MSERTAAVREAEGTATRLVDRLCTFYEGVYADRLAALERENERLKRIIDAVLTGPRADEETVPGISEMMVGIIDHTHAPALLRHCINQGQRAEESRKAAEEAECDKVFCQEWYAVRIARLADLLKEYGLWDQGAAILANGPIDHMEPPTYAQTLNRMRHRAEKAEQELAQARRALALAGSASVAPSVPESCGDGVEVAKRAGGERCALWPECDGTCECRRTGWIPPQDPW